MKTIVNVVYMIFFWTSYGLAIVFIGIFFARLCLMPLTLTLTDFAWLFMCIVMVSQLMIHMTRHPHKKFFELPFKNELL